ncbi:something about silencing protein 10 isoform X1 [Pieris brassicae]|uniref:something about silencing protein 10 isoform X1 n=1 Tax=Pieris brassicae TaxID=7116 RepID=UPI001E661EE0|nr:something about silencing protein 10 isoform X1 [Pieris brassicae]
MADKITVNNSKFDLDDNYEVSESDTEKENKLLGKLKHHHDSESSSEEEVYRFSESENESEKNDLEMADSDVEGQEKSDDDLPDSKAWGKKKRSYYSTDYVDEDYGGFGDDEDAALMEEEEAKNIQKRLIEQLEEDDFKLDFLTPLQPAYSENEETVIKNDLSQMSKRQKLQLLEKESPEFAGLIEDYKSKLSIAKDNLQPLLKLVSQGKVPECSASKFVKTKYDLILNYCTNISFYVLLKSQRITIQNHPVTKRLYQYRQMLNKMEPIYLEVIKPQIDKIISAVENKVKLVVRKENMKRKSTKLSLEQPLKKLKLINKLEKDDGEDTGVSDNDYDGNDFFKSSAGFDDLANKQTESDESGFSDNDDLEAENNKPSTSQEVTMEELGEKREITYQIAKNKGLTPHRKKEQRNPRVKHKLKYRKAKIRRKGAIREPRTEVTRYAGEASGIKTNVKKSIKIK